MATVRRLWIEVRIKKLEMLAVNMSSDCDTEVRNSPDTENETDYRNGKQSKIGDAE
jgi:hypothetical protein